MEKKSFNINSPIFKEIEYKNIEKETELIVEIFSDFEDLLTKQNSEIDVLEVNVSKNQEIIEKVAEDAIVIEENKNTNRKYIAIITSTLSCATIFFFLLE